MAKHTFKDNSSRAGLDSHWKKCCHFQALFWCPRAGDFGKAGEPGAAGRGQEAALPMSAAGAAGTFRPRCLISCSSLS